MNPAGKTCLITGANSGIGKATALGLARQQARVVMLCRNKDKAEQAREEIFKISGNNEVHILLCDLSSQEQIHVAAEQFQQRFDQLDILINNAGILVGNERQLTEDGFEMTFAVNHLAPYTLTLLQLDLLKRSPDGRIINVSSEAHRFARYDIHDLQLEHHPYNGLNAYAISKLCNIWFTRRLSKLIAGNNITVNSLHPGFVASDFGKNASVFSKAALKLFSPFSISPAKGARTPLYLATSPEVQNISGKYFKGRKRKLPSKDALNDHCAEDLWKKSASLTHLDIHKVTLS